MTITIDAPEHGEICGGFRLTATATAVAGAWRIRVAPVRAGRGGRWAPDREYSSAGAALAAGRAWVRAGYARLAAELLR